MESLQPELAPAGIQAIVSDPGRLRPICLTQESTTFATPSIADYADRHAERVPRYETMHGRQARFDATKVGK